MQKNILTMMVLLIGTFYFSSCVNDPQIPNEEEVITTLKYTLTPTNSGTPVVLTFQDLDGDGGTAPTISSGTLDSNTTYTGSLELLNEIEQPAEDITSEIQNEAEEHQFFFQSTVDGLTIAYDDQDTNNQPIGLASTVTTTNTGTGTLTIILRHEPNKTAQGVAQGDITEAGGETDIEVTFEVNVQ